MVDFAELFRFARDLQRAVGFGELLDLVRTEVRAQTGYQHAWLAVFEPDRAHLRILAASGDIASAVWDKAAIIPIADDPMIAEILAGAGAVVVDDARTDPRTNKRIVEALGNRTIVNVPLTLLETPLGMLGTGTFADEGPRPPTRDALDALVAIASQVSVAASRIRWLGERAAAERQRSELLGRLHTAQRLESLGMLAGGVAHDFNNLITVVNVCAQNLGEGPLTAAQAEELESLRAAAVRAQALTGKLLAVGRQQPQRLVPLDLNVRLRALVPLFRGLVTGNVTIDVIEAAHLPTILGDGTQLDQVLLNLVSNARDALPAGGKITIETEAVRLNGEYVAAHPWARPGRYVLITVTDDGTGMDAATLDRIFEPFFSTKGDSGTGLGLAVAYGIVQQHGGMLSAYSELRVGTTFKLYLPAYERAASAVGHKLEGAVVGGEERVLIAEDDPVVRSVVRQILARAGYDVTVVADGVEAVDAVARGERFDVVILDAVMPRLHGPAALAEIVRLGSDAAFLFSSGYGTELLAPDLVTAHRVELLEKPYDPDTLLRTVRRALDARKRGDRS